MTPDNPSPAGPDRPTTPRPPRAAPARGTPAPPPGHRNHGSALRRHPGAPRLKAAVEYGHSVMTHAMVLTGVDLNDKGRPRRWKVENSWGDKVGDKGYFVMSDRWFDEYMFEVVIARRHLPKRVLKALDTEPVVLPPWDPMGSLARDC